MTLIFDPDGGIISSNLMPQYFSLFLFFENFDKVKHLVFSNGSRLVLLDVKNYITKELKPLFFLLRSLTTMYKDDIIFYHFDNIIRQFIGQGWILWQ